MAAAYIHPNALCDSPNIGEGTRIWAFAHVLPKAVLGQNCNICDGVFIENDVVIGNNVTIKCGVQVWDGTRIEDNVQLGPNATLTNDRWPRAGNRDYKVEGITIRRWASIGGNATILPGIEIGEGAMVGAGAVVTKNVPPHAIVVGNPARIVGYSTDKVEEAAE